MRLLVLLILLLGLAGCQHEPETLRVGSNRWPGYGPFYLADERGMLEAARVELVEYPHTTGVMRAFENGLLDAAFVTLDEALRLAADGLNLEIVLVADVSAGADALYSKSHINQLADLQGQRIGVENTALGAYFLSRILDRAHLSEEQLTIVNLPVNEHARALREGQIDAVVSFASEEEALHASGAHRLFDSRELPYAIIDVLVVARDRRLASSTQRLRRIWSEQLDWWRANPQAAQQLLDHRLGTTSEDLSLTMSQLLLGDRSLNNQMLHEGVLQAQLLQLESYLLERGLIRQRPANSLLPECRGAQC